MTTVSTDSAPAGGRQLLVETVRFDRLSALVRVVGELDLGSASALWAILEGHVGSGRRFVRLDLSGLTFLDVSALPGITRAHQQLLGQRGTLVVTGVRSTVARVLRLTGLDATLFVSGSRGDLDIEIADGPAQAPARPVRSSARSASRPRRAAG